MATFFKREDLEGGLRRLTLQRAPVNALNPAFLDALAVEYADAAADGAVRALVIASDLKVMSAGLDLKEAQGFDLAEQAEIVRGLNESFLALYALPKPTVAAVNGAAIAGGLFFVLGCDVRVAVPRASFGLAEVRVGATLPAGPYEIARAEIGRGAFRRLLLSGQPIGAQEAVSVGIVDRICEPEELAEESLRLARDYAALPPQTYATAKRQLRGDAVARIEAAIAGGANKPEGGWFSDETKAAMAAMVAR